MTLYLKGDDHTSFIEEAGVKVIKFTATWCGPCKVVAPKYEDLANRYTDALFVNIDIDEESSIAKKYDIMSVPTFVVLKDGNVFGTMPGTDMRKLELLVDKTTKLP